MDPRAASIGWACQVDPCVELEVTRMQTREPAGVSHVVI